MAEVSHAACRKAQLVLAAQVGKRRLPGTHRLAPARKDLLVQVGIFAAASCASSNPASSKHSRIAAFQYASPPRSNSSRRLAWASSSPRSGPQVRPKHRWRRRRHRKHMGAAHECGRLRAPDHEYFDSAAGVTHQDQRRRGRGTST